ncbi:MAG: CPBP family intramembrane metalloprotease [Bacteroides sp.]|nr:CPBP family intramembrane metalloprotease [Bacteroides sp.]
MKTSIKLVLLYFAFQTAGAILAMFGGVVYLMVTQQPVSVEALQNHSLAPALFLGIVLMAFYLWKAGYISKEKVTWSPISASYLMFSVVFYAAFLFLIEFILSLMPWLPDLMEQSFADLQSNWLGIACITLLGPILEELLFRGAITKALLQTYNPGKAIILSALIFGIFHINPAQVVSAGLIGVVLAWIYYKTASLIPCILLHVLNNSLSVFLSTKYPEMEYFSESLGSVQYAIVLAVALGICIGIYWIMDKIQIPYPWKKEQTEIK